MKLLAIGLAVWAGALAGCAAKKPISPPEPAPVVLAATAPRPALSGRPMFTVVAGPAVHNLRQVERGDVVRVEYRRSIAYAAAGDVVDVTYTEAVALAVEKAGGR